MPISALLGGIWDKWGLCSVSHKKIIIRINIQCGTLYTDQYTRLFWFTSLPCLLLFLTSGCRETCRTPPYLAGTIHGFHWIFSHLNPSEPIWSIMEVSCPDRPSGLSFGPLLDAPRATGCYGSRIEAVNPPKKEFGKRPDVYLQKKLDKLFLLQTYFLSDVQADSLGTTQAMAISTFSSVTSE